MGGRRGVSIAIRVLLCLVVEAALVLSAALALVVYGWQISCSAENPCHEGEAMRAYLLTAPIGTSIPTVYGVVSLVLGRTPGMVLLRVPSAWKAFRKPAPSRDP